MGDIHCKVCGNSYSTNEEFQIHKGLCTAEMISNSAKLMSYCCPEKGCGRYFMAFTGLGRHTTTQHNKRLIDYPEYADRVGKPITKETPKILEAKKTAEIFDAIPEKQEISLPRSNQEGFKLCKRCEILYLTSTGIKRCMECGSELNQPKIVRLSIQGVI